MQLDTLLVYITLMWLLTSLSSACLMRRCWLTNPVERPTFKQLKTQLQDVETSLLEDYAVVREEEESGYIEPNNIVWCTWPWGHNCVTIKSMKVITSFHYLHLATETLYSTSCIKWYNARWAYLLHQYWMLMLRRRNIDRDYGWKISQRIT